MSAVPPALAATPVRVVHGVEGQFVVKQKERRPRSGESAGHEARQGRRPTAQKPPALVPGLAAREVAVQVIAAVIGERRAFDEAWSRAESAPRCASMEPRDRAFARLIVATVLRRLGRLDSVLAGFLSKPLPAAEVRLRAILLSGLAQLLLIDTPPHAALSLAVDQCRLDHRTRRYDKLVNAILRRATREGAARMAEIGGDAIDVPAWLLARWQLTYGRELAAQIVATSLREAPIDLTVKSDAASWAARLGGQVLASGSVRLASGGRIEALSGYAEGAWWVQDAAAALPARLLGDVQGLSVADLCAAPGGKSAGLAALGARVTALDRSPDRLQRLAANLDRLGLSAQLVAADAATWKPEQLFDAVLLDAPCTATGTVRRHPDILRLRRQADVAALAETQRAILVNAANLVKPGGLLVYCTCSLEPEEGEHQIAAFLAGHGHFERQPIAPGEGSIEAGWITPAGDMRTLPCHLQLADPGLSGMDGFYAARLRRVH